MEPDRFRYDSPATGLEYTDEIENQRRINELAAEAKEGHGKSLKERLSRMALGWAGDTALGRNAVAIEPRPAGRDYYGYPVYESPTVPQVADGRHYIGDIFAPAQPDIEVQDHMKVVREWIAEEELSKALSVGSTVDCIVEAAKVMTARRILKIVEAFGERARAEGDVLYIGRRAAKDVAGLIPMVKPQILRELNGRQGEREAAGTVRGVRAEDGAAAGGAANADQGAGPDQAAPPGDGPGAPGGRAT